MLAMVGNLLGRSSAWAGTMRRVEGPTGLTYTSGRGPKDAARGTAKTRPSIFKTLPTGEPVRGGPIDLTY